MNYLDNINWYIVLISYLLGSVPFGIILTRIAKTPDLRTIGSGNIGATNVLRTGNKKLALLTLLLDAFKGYLAVYISSYWGENTTLLVACFALIGHLFPIWLLFKGGKGVATYFGILIAFTPQLAIVFALIWIIVLIIGRYSSVAALSATLFTPLTFWLLNDKNLAILFSLLTLLIYIRHSNNIQRLIKGQESKIFRKNNDLFL